MSQVTLLLEQFNFKLIQIGPYLTGRALSFVNIIDVKVDRYMDLEKNKVRRGFCDQRARCRIRKDINGNPIQFKLTFEEWLKIWIDSGKFHLRGKKIGQYCMSRIGDKGHYEVGNVFIQLNSQNRVDAMLGKPRPEHSAKMKALLKAKKDLKVLNEF